MLIIYFEEQSCVEMVLSAHSNSKDFKILWAQPIRFVHRVYVSLGYAITFGLPRMLTQLIIMKSWESSEKHWIFIDVG